MNLGQNGKLTHLAFTIQLGRLKFEGSVQNSRLKFQNAANIMAKMLQIQMRMNGSTSKLVQNMRMPCKMNGSISTMKIEIPGKYDAN